MKSQTAGYSWVSNLMLQTTEFNKLNVNTTSRLLFWHDLVGYLPLTCLELNEISLYLVGENGLAAKSWKNTEDLRKKVLSEQEI